MLKEISLLEDRERDILLKAPALVAILVAGVEGAIDKDEIETAEKIIKYRRISGDIRLFTYYDNVHLSFHNNLIALERQYSDNPWIRSLQICNELEQLNAILPKLGKELAVAVYKNLKMFAKHVAESSGGFLGFLSISSEERKLIELKMINDPETYMPDEHIKKGQFHIDVNFLDSSSSQIHP